MSWFSAPITILTVIVISLLITRPSPLVPLVDLGIDFLVWVDGVKEYNNREGGYMGGNWAPVSKEHQNVRIDLGPSKIPPELEGGMYVRNGANPRCWPPSNVHHAFNGEAMLHMISLAEGEIRFSNSWVPHPEKKDKTCTQGATGDVTFGGFSLYRMLLSSLRSYLAGIPLPPTERLQPGGTSTLLLGGKLYTLTEAFLPYEIEVSKQGEIKSKGFSTFQGMLTNQAKGPVDGTMSAHPRIDPKTGDLTFFSTNLGKGSLPRIAYGTVFANGTPDRYFHIPVENSPPSAFYHDMLLTENFAIVMDTSLKRDPSRMARGLSTYFFNSSHNMRFGVLPRSACCASEVTWVTTSSPGYVWHTVSAWEEEDRLVLMFPKFSTYPESLPIHLTTEPPSLLTKFELNLSTGLATEQVVLDDIVERPSVSPAVISPSIAYLRSEGTNSREMGAEMIKYDLRNQVVLGRLRCQVECVFGEALFVPRNEESEEDDGFLMDIVYIPSNHTSRFMIWNASTLGEPIINVELPQRVPYGVHGQWLNKEYF